MERLLTERRATIVKNAFSVLRHSGCSYRKLGYVAQFRNGKDAKGIESVDGAYPVYGSGGVFKRANSYLFDGPSVLFGRKGTLDKPLLVDGKFWTVDTMYYTVLSAEVCPSFLHKWATTLPFEMNSTDTALPSMTSTVLSQLRIPLPPLGEQRRIADEIERETAEIDSMLEDITKLRDLLAERRAAVISAAVTGQIDIPVSPTHKDEPHA
ncbi:type I restriction endonuclease subunit S [Corynebacterium accolens]|uniref:Type I restriction endonuclease subunit S n=2 Tax=Corynebacterium TaxID=1716 RepID=A0A2A4AID9_9CORY|nr:type I restriction endonuclease subunit S [Corynebacterium accolens]